MADVLLKWQYLSHRAYALKATQWASPSLYTGKLAINLYHDGHMGKYKIELGKYNIISITKVIIRG